MSTCSYIHMHQPGRFEGSPPVAGVETNSATLRTRARVTPTPAAHADGRRAPSERWPTPSCPGDPPAFASWTPAPESLRLRHRDACRAERVGCVASAAVAAQHAAGRPRRAGRLVFYALDDQHIIELFQQALTHVEGQDR